MPNQALYPVSWIEFCAVFTNLGYSLSHFDEKNKVAIFTLSPDQKENGLTPAITVAYPDFTNKFGDQCFEKEYVLDLVDRMIGREGSEVVAALLARRRIDS